jgi:RES domain
LGPPSPEFAKQNRMSPAGIVMTYVSEEAATALDETADEPGTYAIGQFRTLRDITILDLAQLPPIPSLFAEIPDTLEYDPHEALIFLHRLAEDISRLIERDDRVHIEYVPTQVVTEFLRTAKMPDKRRLDGIRYRSSRRSRGTSLVLFADPRNVVGAWDKPWPKPDAWLELTGRTEGVVP